MGRKIEKIKIHFRENKKAYIAFGGGVVVCLVANAARDPELNVGNTMKNGVFYKPEQRLNIHIEALGDPGNIIQDVSTGTVYASQNQAAKELGVHRARISEHLAGKLDTVNGHTLTKLGKAPVAA